MYKFSLTKLVLAGIGTIIAGILVFFGERIGEKLLNTTLTTVPSLGFSLSDLVVSGLIIIGLAVAIYGLYDLRKLAKQPLTGSAGESVRHISTRIEVKQKTLTNQDVYLDGHSWEECKFINCNIIIERGDFDLISNSFDHCRLTAKGGAIGIIKVAKLFLPDIPIIEPSISESTSDSKT